MSAVPVGPVPSTLDPTERRYRVALTLVCALVALVATTWAVVTPGFRAPDETQHLNSVVRLAYGGGWPEPGAALVGPAVEVAQEQSARASDLPGRTPYRADQPQFADMVPVPDDERVAVGAQNALPDPADGTAGVDQMTQHPPLYYALAAATLRATGLADARWDVMLLAVRLLDVVLLVPLAPLAAASVRRLTGSRPAALLAAAFPLLVPQTAFILGSVTNDALVTLTGAVLTYLCVRVLTGDLGWRTATLVGLVAGLGLLTKVMPGFALPTVVLSYLVAAGGSSLVTRLARVAGTLVVGFVVGGWWWARNLLVHGTVQPVGVPAATPTVPAGGLDEYLPAAWEMLTRTFWGNFGWFGLRADPVVVAVATGLLVLVCLAATAGRRYGRQVAVLLVLPVLLALFVLLNGWFFYREHAWITGVQGRYVFAGLSAVAIAFGVGLLTLLDRRAGALERAVPLVVTIGLAVSAAGLALGFAAMYRAPGESLVAAGARWVAWSPLTGVQAGLVLFLAASAGVAAVMSATAFARTAAARARPTDAVPATTARTVATRAGTGADE